MIKMLAIVGIVFSLALQGGGLPLSTGMAPEVVVPFGIGNPAAVYCEEMGYEYERVSAPTGETGLCHMPDGEACAAWDFLEGKCGQDYSYCAQQGHRITTASDGKDPFSREYAVCVTDEGDAVGTVTELFELTQKATGCGGEMQDQEPPPTGEEGNRYEPSSVLAPPSSFDWRNYLGSNWLTSVKDQGSCGSCWAFSAVGVAEAAHNIAADNPGLDLDLSEQYLVADCSDAGNCCGGWPYKAFRYIRDSGIPDEGCMPYVDGSGCTCFGTCNSNCTHRYAGRCSDRTCSDRCGNWSSRREYIVSTGSVLNNPEVMKQALVDLGPLSVTMRIGTSNGGYFDGDVYRCTIDTPLNHAVALVGYSDAGGYWLVRNSWGIGYQDGGYFKVGYGECDIEHYIDYADVGPLYSGPISYNGLYVDDNMSGNSVGNGNGIADCGETIELYVDLYNQGTGYARSVDATISTGDPYVTWLFNTDSDYPDIPGGDARTNSNDYDFYLNPCAPDNHMIDFDLDISASSVGPWTDSFLIQVNCDVSTCSRNYLPTALKKHR